MGIPLVLSSQLPVLSLPLVRLGSGSFDLVLTSGSLVNPSLDSSRVNEDKYKVEVGKVKTGVKLPTYFPPVLSRTTLANA